MKDALKPVATTLALAILTALYAFSGTAVRAADSPAEEIMKKSHLAYYYAADDGVAEVEMTLKDKKGKERTRVFTMLRKDYKDGGEQRYYTYFKEPTDVSRMTFMVWKNPDKNDDRWIYIPSLDLVKSIAANDKQSSFVGSDFTYEDVSGRHWTEDDHSLEREESFEGKEAYVIKSVPREKNIASYAYRLSWIDKASSLPLKEEYYDKKDAVVRIFKAEETKEMGGILTITKRSMTDTKKGHSTVVAFSEIKYNMGVKDDIFSERYLRQPPREYIR